MLYASCVRQTRNTRRRDYDKCQRLAGYEPGREGAENKIQKTYAEKVTGKRNKSARCDAQRQGPELELQKVA